VPKDLHRDPGIRVKIGQLAGAGRASVVHVNLSVHRPAGSGVVEAVEVRGSIEAAVPRREDQLEPRQVVRIWPGLRPVVRGTD
jgi:hypothetical protein